MTHRPPPLPAITLAAPKASGRVRTAGGHGAVVRCAALWLVIGLATSGAAAQGSATGAPTLAPAQATNTAAPVTRALPPDSGWHRLRAAEKQALAPLAAIWDKLTPGQRRKWRELAVNFKGLSMAEQAKMQERMTEWARLTPQARAQARLNFGKTTEIAKELTPAEKLAKWEAYQALSPEERRALAKGAKTRPHGAAPAIKPVPTQKLAGVPAPTPVRPSVPEAAVTSDATVESQAQTE